MSQKKSQKIGKSLLKKLLRDHRQAQIGAQGIKETGSNLYVQEKDKYLDPPISKESSSSGDGRGALEYFQRIRNALGNLIIGEPAKYSWHFEGAPEEIKRLLLPQ